MKSRLAVAGGTPLRTKPFPSWPVHDAGDRERILATLESGTWGSDGPMERDFEQAFAARHDALGAVAVTNGTVTLLLCLRALGIRPGDEVIVPALTWTATATSVIEANAVPVFADVDPETWCMDPASVEAHIGPRTFAIMPVHLYSHMADMDALRRIAERHRLALIEDCAHAHGARWRGRSAGTLGRLGSFSFQSSKPMTAGEGGAIVSTDSALLDACWSQKNCGRTKDGRGAAVFGGNHRMTEMQAAMLLGQLARLDVQRARREANLAHLRACLTNVPGVRLLDEQEEVTARPQYRFSFAYDKAAAKGIPLRDFVAAVRAEGIPVEHTYPAVYRNVLYRPDEPSWAIEATRRRPAPECPVAERISETGGFTLAHPALLGSREDVEDVAAAFELVLAHASQAAGLRSRLEDAARGALRRLTKVAPAP